MEPWGAVPPPGVGARVSVWRESTWVSAQVCEHRSRQSNAAGIRHEVRVSYDDDGTAAWHDAREIQFRPLVRGDLQPPAAHHPAPPRVGDALRAGTMAVAAARLLCRDRPQPTGPRA